MVTLLEKTSKWQFNLAVMMTMILPIYVNEFKKNEFSNQLYVLFPVFKCMCLS